LQRDITLLDSYSCLLFGKVNRVPDQVGRAGAAQHKQLMLRPAHKPCCAKCLSVPVAPFKMSSIARATAAKCFKPFAS